MKGQKEWYALAVLVVPSRKTLGLYGGDKPLVVGGIVGLLRRKTTRSRSCRPVNHEAEGKIRVLFLAVECRKERIAEKPIVATIVVIGGGTSNRQILVVHSLALRILHTIRSDIMVLHSSAFFSGFEFGNTNAIGRFDTSVMKD
jgi:hypothetical protein